MDPVRKLTITMYQYQTINWAMVVRVVAQRGF